MSNLFTFFLCLLSLNCVYAAQTSFLHISDVHLLASYSYGSLVSDGCHPANEVSAEHKVSTKATAGLFGDYSCDASPALVQSAFACNYLSHS